MSMSYNNADPGSGKLSENTAQIVLEQSLLQPVSAAFHLLDMIGIQCTFRVNIHPIKRFITVMEYTVRSHKQYGKHHTANFFCYPDKQFF